MKCKFVIPEGFGPNKERRRICKASDVVVMDGVRRNVPPPTPLLKRLGEPDLVVGVDVETHDWRDNSSNKGRFGRFNWYTLKDEEDIAYGRIIQLGWVIGGTESVTPVDVKTVLVKPGHDMCVSSKATVYHKISQDRLDQQGRPLEEALRMFMHEVTAAYERGARVVAHHFEFDAGVIWKELGRCGLTDLQIKWTEIARGGYCTMNPDVGRWTLECAGKEFGPQNTMHTLGLKRMVILVAPQYLPMIENHHDAGADAQMARLIYVALLRRAQSHAKTKKADAKQEGCVPTPEGSDQYGTAGASDATASEMVNLRRDVEEEKSKQEFKSKHHTPSLVVADQHGAQEAMVMIHTACHESAMEKEAREMAI